MSAFEGHYDSSEMEKSAAEILEHLKSSREDVQLSALKAAEALPSESMLDAYVEPIDDDDSDNDNDDEDEVKVPNPAKEAARAAKVEAIAAAAAKAAAAPSFIRLMCRLVSSPNSDISSLALTLLTNVAADFPMQAIPPMLTAKVTSRVTEIIITVTKKLLSENDSPKASPTFNSSVQLARIEAGFLLLINTTRTDEGCKQFLEKKAALDLLLTAFISPEIYAVDEDDTMAAFASVLMNVTQIDVGRNYVLRISEGVLGKLLPQMRHRNVVRRHGITGVVKNICFEKDSAWWLINEAKIVVHLLYPLVGPEEFDLDEKTGMDPQLWIEGCDKDREGDDDIRLLLLETLLLLCATGRHSRKILREQKVYAVIKALDLVEEETEHSEKIDEIVQFLMRDEVGEEHQGPIVELPEKTDKVMVIKDDRPLTEMD
jgi:hypothetical protein